MTASDSSSTFRQRPTGWVLRTILSLSLMDWLIRGWFRCPFAIPFVSCGQCPVTNCPGTWLQAFLAPAILIFALFRNRPFCAWACPLGYGLDHLPAGGKPRPAIIRLLPAAFLICLVLVFLANDTTGPLMNSVSEPIRPWDYVVRADESFTVSSTLAAIQMGLSRYWLRIGLAGLILITSLIFHRRWWCASMCPLGKLQGIARWPARKLARGKQSDLIVEVVGE